MSEQPDQSEPADPAPQEPQAQPVAGGDDDGPPGCRAKVPRTATEC